MGHTVYSKRLRPSYMIYEKATAQYIHIEIGLGLRPSRLILFWALKGACCTLSFQTHPLSLTLQVSLDVGTWAGGDSEWPR